MKDLDWSELQKEFEMNESEPDELIFVSYDGDGYDASIFIMYRNGSKYYIVEGSHCSCFGFEDQWDPTEYENKDILIKSLVLRSYRCYPFKFSNLINLLSINNY